MGAGLPSRRGCAGCCHGNLHSCTSHFCTKLCLLPTPPGFPPLSSRNLTSTLARRLLRQRPLLLQSVDVSVSASQPSCPPHGSLSPPAPWGMPLLIWPLLPENVSRILFYLFIYLLMAVLGLHCCVWALSSCSKQGPLFAAVCGPLTAAASLVVEHGL